MTANGVHIPRVLSADETAEVEKLVARGRYDEAAERFGGRVTHAHEQRDLPPMSDFDTITAGTDDLVNRLRDYEEYEQSQDGQIICVKSDIAQEAAARIEQLEIRANAATAAAFEVAALAINDRGAVEQENFGLDRATQNFFRARDIVRAIATPGQTAALDRLISEAVESAAETAAQFIHTRLYEADIPACSYHSRDIKDAILAANKKGGV